MILDRLLLKSAWRAFQFEVSDTLASIRVRIEAHGVLSCHFLRSIGIFGFCLDVWSFVTGRYAKHVLHIRDSFLNYGFSVFGFHDGSFRCFVYEWKSRPKAAPICESDPVICRWRASRRPWRRLPRCAQHLW